MDGVRRTTNRQQFSIIYETGNASREMTIAVKNVRQLPGDVEFEVFCFETDRYETILSSMIARCLHLKTGRAIKDLGRRYTVNRMR